MPDPVRSPSSIPIPDDFPRWFIRHGGSLGRAGYGGEVAPDVGTELISVADLPKLYAYWAEQLVAKIRSEGFRDAHPDEGYDGPLHEAIANAAGSYSSEFWPTDKLVEGVADYVADLLGLEDRT